MSVLERIGHMNEAARDAHVKADAIIDELNNQTRWLAVLADRVQAAGEREHFQRIPLQTVANAAGVATVTLQTPAGIGWELVSAALTGGDASTDTGAVIYLGSNDPINLVHVFSYGTRMSDIFSAGEYVPPGQNVIVEFTGQAAGQLCTVNLKIKTLKD